MRIALRTSLRFDQRAIDAPGAARAAAGCVISLALGLGVVGDTAAAAATVGALLTGVPTIAATRRRPLGTMASTTCGLVLSTFVGVTTARFAVAHLVILGIWAFGAGLLVALGDTGSVVGTQATMAFIVFGRFDEPLHVAAELAAYIAAGGVIQMALVALTRWPAALSAQRNLVAEAYLALSGLAAAGPEYSGMSAGSALDAADAALGSPLLLRRADLGIVRSLVDEGRRMRVELSGLQTLRGQLRHLENAHAPEFAERLDGALDDAARLLEMIAGVIADRAGPRLRSSGSSSFPDAGGSLDAIASAISAVDEADRSSPALAAALANHVGALAGQLRAAATLATETSDRRDIASGAGALSSRRLARTVAERLRAQLALLVANLSLRSTACRHAVRLATVVVVAELLAAHTPLERGYWVPLTAALVLRPDFGSTFSRGFARLMGTIVGVGVTGIIVAGGHLGGGPAIAIIGVLAFAGFASFRASYAVFTAMLTGLVVLLVNLGVPSAHSTFSTAGDRLLDTLIGGAIALIAYALWPTWTADEARDALVATVRGEQTYLGAVLAAVACGGTPPEAELASAARKLRLARSNAEAVVARSLTEPQGRRVDPALASSVLAALRRLSLTTHVVRTALSASTVRPPIPEVTPLADALDQALSQVIDALGGAVVGTLPPLRRLHNELRNAVAGRGDATLLVIETDEIVDVIDTLGDVVGSTATAAMR